MELLFESRPDVTTTGRVYARQHKPAITDEPVLRPQGDGDSLGASIYGSVLHDQGMYRMWYQAWSADWSGRNTASVGYAESDDGLTWRKPALNLVDIAGSTANNLCDLGLHAPCVFIDPDAPTSHRYRATGHGNPGYGGTRPGLTFAGYYTAHSQDGLHWQLDSDRPRWWGGDVISSCYHPERNKAIVSLKRIARVGNVRRRSIWQAELVDGRWSDDRCALVPDEGDDLSARHYGYLSADYYGLGAMPAGQGMVGFLWQFRHMPPFDNGPRMFGRSDVSLCYQPHDGGRWLHPFGRENFLASTDRPWMAGGVYTAGSVLEQPNEQWLYFTGTQRSHAWHLNDDRSINDARLKQVCDEGFASIGLARWPKDRLFSLAADTEGVIEIDLPNLQPDQTITLNYRCLPGGSLKAQLVDHGQVGPPVLAEAAPMTGDELAAPVHWQSPPDLTGKQDFLKLRLTVDRAEVFAFECA